MQQAQQSLGAAASGPADFASQEPPEFALIVDRIRAHAAARPNHPAFVQEGRSLSYGELVGRIDRVGAALQRDGVAQRGAISICATTSIEYATLFLGAISVGVVAAPLAPSSTPEQLRGMIADSGSKLLFLDSTTADSLAGVEGVRRVALDDGPAGEAFSQWLAPAGARPAPVEIAPNDPFNMIYSSGTTGVPKGIVQSHKMRWGHVMRSSSYGYGEDSTTILSTPLYSNTTLVAFFPTLSAGGTVALMKKFNALEFLGLAQKLRATHAMLVPVQYSRIMALPEFDAADLSSFRMKTCTSAPFAPELKAEVLRRWPGGLIELYGMTEGGGSCILFAHQFPDKLDTVGRPAEGHDIRLIDEEGREVAPGEIGEIVGHSPMIMLGYHNQEGKTREAQWVSPEGKVFMRTGDVGRFDADGFLKLMDRRKDMIISGGFNIYPSDLESELDKHPDVRECAVVGVKSEEWGETPLAFAVLRDGATADAEALRAFANEKLGKTQRLSRVEIVETLPRSAIGKILKRELRDDYEARRKSAS